MDESESIRKCLLSPLCALSAVLDSEDTEVDTMFQRPTPERSPFLVSRGGGHIYANGIIGWQG